MTITIPQPEIQEAVSLANTFSELSEKGYHQQLEELIQEKMLQELLDNEIQTSS